MFLPRLQQYKLANYCDEKKIAFFCFIIIPFQVFYLVLDILSLNHKGTKGFRKKIKNSKAIFRFVVLIWAVHNVQSILDAL